MAHMYCVLYRLICNLVPFATDMIYGRHLGFQNYPILVFGQCNPVNLHPNLTSTQQTFAKDVLSLLATNPFVEDNGDMLTLDTMFAMNKDAIRTVNAVEEIGQRQFSESVEDRLKIASNKPLSDIVSKNKLALFSTPQTKQRSISKEQFASLKTNCTLFSRFYIACQLGKATSTVSLNTKIRRAIRPFLIWANCDRDRNRT